MTRARSNGALTPAIEPSSRKDIEDCAHAIETEYKGRKAGTFGDFGCFSFYVTKNTIIGEGGMVLAQNEENRPNQSAWAPRVMAYSNPSPGIDARRYATFENIQLFRQRGALVLYDFIEEDVADEMIRAIDALRADEIMNVDRSNMRFRTIHGNFASQKVPYVAELQDRVLRIVNLLAEDTYGPLQQRDIGLSLNVTPPGGRFGCHYDRNRLTAVLYLNALPLGGEMELWPRYHYRSPERFPQRVHDIGQRLIDGFGIDKLVGRIIGRKLNSRRNC